MERGRWIPELLDPRYDEDAEPWPPDAHAIQERSNRVLAEACAMLDEIDLVLGQNGAAAAPNPKPPRDSGQFDDEEFYLGDAPLKPTP